MAISTLTVYSTHYLFMTFPSEYSRGAPLNYVYYYLMQALLQYIKTIYVFLVNIQLIAIFSKFRILLNSEMVRTRRLPLHTYKCVCCTAKVKEKSKEFEGDYQIFLSFFTKFKQPLRRSIPIIFIRVSITHILTSKNRRTNKLEQKRDFNRSNFTLLCT